MLSLLLLMLALAALPACRSEAERGHGATTTSSASDPASGTTAEEVVFDPAGGTPGALTSPLPRPTSVTLPLRTPETDATPAAPLLPEPGRPPAGLTVLAATATQPGFVAVIDDGLLRRWTIALDGTPTVLTPLPLVEGPTLVEAYSCGAVRATGSSEPLAVLLRRTPGRALEPVLVRGDRLEALPLPDTVELVDAGARPCAVAELADGRFVLLGVQRSGALALLLYIAAGAEHAVAALEPDAAAAAASVELEPAFSVARSPAGGALVGWRAQLAQSRVYAVIELDASGRIVRAEEVSNHRRRTVMGVVDWRGSVPGAWVARFDDAVALEVAYEEAELAFRPLGGAALEPDRKSVV